ncbi:MAG: hypothetical protein PHF00_04500 [Elusimicrobia bacterium]|nr:hypothetical protein [Elusimicrobiota bacterium]
MNRAILVSVCFFMSGVPAAAQSLGTTARQLPKGSLKILAYYEGVHDQTVNFNVAAPAVCTAPGGASFACGQGGDVEAKGRGGAGVVKLVYQPWDSFQYYAAVGVGDYSLSVPSTTVTNVLTGDNPGLILTGGLKAVIMPDTIVTPAVAVDASISRSRYSFNRTFPGGTPGVGGNIDQRLTMMRYQVAVEASDVFTVKDADEKADDQAKLTSWRAQGVKLEPYGGVKWSRLQSDLKDLASGGHSGGQQDTVSPFLGLRIPVYEHEGLFAEASFVDGYEYAAGLEVRF